jgi:hypothetical protein
MQTPEDLLREVAAQRDEDIDFSDIPENSFEGGVRGFHRFPRGFIMENHCIHVWNIRDGRWEKFRSWMQWCPWMLIRVDGSFTNFDCFPHRMEPWEKGQKTRACKCGHTETRR